MSLEPRDPSGRSPPAAPAAPGAAAGRGRRFAAFVLTACAALVGPAPLPAAEPAAPASEPAHHSARPIADLSLDELTSVQFVTSVAKKPQRLADAAAAIHVIDANDIAGAPTTGVPDLLRDVPGLFVGSVDAHTWAISSRGFNDAFGNKLLVLLDGRSVYTPLFSGVYWDVQDTVLQDVNRIEVVRGPGATMWGANAVNGVINVTTKHTRDTLGTLVSAGGGSEDLAFGTVRYGGRISSNAFYRVYAKYNIRDASELLGQDHLANDRWNVTRTGFRADWDPEARDQLTLQGDLYVGREDQTYRLARLTPPSTVSVSRPTDLFGANVLGRWRRTLSADSELSLQAYYDHTDRDLVPLRERRDTMDVDFQHRFALGSRQDVNWGAGYRLSQDHLRDSFTLSFDSRERADQLFSWFVQDELSVIPERLHLTGGFKLEHNDYTGFEYQPRASAHLQIHEHHSLWASVSRAVRTPSRAEHDIRINDQVFAGSPPVVVSIFGNPAFRSETVLAYEAGYRYQPSARWSADLALFYNEYRHLRTTEQVGGPTPDPSLPGTPLVQRVNIDNLAYGETYGAELSLRWQVNAWWTLRGSYSAMNMALHQKPGSNDGDAEIDEDKSPQHQVRLHSSINLSGGWRLDVLGRYVDGVRDFNIASYVELDGRIAWSPRPNLEISINGHNLLDNRHAEFWPTILNSQRTETERGIFGQVTIRF